MLNGKCMYFNSHKEASFFFLILGHLYGIMGEKVQCMF